MFHVFRGSATSIRVTIIDAICRVQGFLVEAGVAACDQ